METLIKAGWKHSRYNSNTQKRNIWQKSQQKSCQGKDALKSWWHEKVQSIMKTLKKTVVKNLREFLCFIAKYSKNLGEDEKIKERKC